MGYTIELCSGLVDKDLPLEQIAKEECIEELDYALKEFERVGDFYTGFGSGVNKQSFYLAVIDENDKICDDGGVDGKQVEAVFVKISEYEEFSKKIIHTLLLDFAYLWSLGEKKELYLE